MKRVIRRLNRDRLRGTFSSMIDQKEDLRGSVPVNNS